MFRNVFFFYYVIELQSDASNRCNTITLTTSFGRLVVPIDTVRIEVTQQRVTFALFVAFEHAFITGI